MYRGRTALALTALLLAGCGRPAPEAGDKRIDADNPLEIAARERGIVRPQISAPTAVFELTHDLGRDAMCVVPDGAGPWRFALTAAFGPGLSCVAHGTMDRDGQEWRLRFAGAEGCEARVREEEDELLLLGGLPPACRRLCPRGASLAGLRLPRASWSEADARGLRTDDGQGNIALPCVD